MKKLLILLTVLTMTILPLTAFADDDATLTVQGSATVTLAPDMAEVTVGVSTVKDAVADAAETNAKLVNSVIDALKALGLTDADMTTQDFNVSPQYDYSSFGTQSVKGYQVHNSLRIVIRDLEQLGAILDAAMNAGANECYGVTFLATGAAEATDKALTLAIAEAARKAQLMADASGLKVYKLEALTENQSGGYYRGAVNTVMDAGLAKGTTILADKLEFSASVTAEYSLTK